MKTEPDDFEESGVFGSLVYGIVILGLVALAVYAVVRLVQAWTA